MVQINESVIPLDVANTDESCDDFDEEEGAFTIDEMRAELRRLMADLHLASKDGASAMSPVATGPGGLCKLPAGVPENPGGLRVTAEMDELLAALLSSELQGQSQVGFCGMGGIGKTTVSAWLARQTSIRYAVLFSV